MGSRRQCNWSYGYLRPSATIQFRELWDVLRYIFGILYCGYFEERPFPMALPIASGYSLNTLSSLDFAQVPLCSPLGSITTPDWDALNATVSGRLYRGVPYAKACFSTFNGESMSVDDEACSVMQKEYFDVHRKQALISFRINWIRPRIYRSATFLSVRRLCVRE